jgi:hypothetical protein
LSAGTLLMDTQLLIAPQYTHAFSAARRAGDRLRVEDCG